MGIVLSWMGGWIPQGVHPIDFWGGGAPGPQRKQAPARQGSPAGNACADLVFFPNGVLQSPPSRGTSLAPVRRLARLPKLSRSVGGAPGFWLWDWQRAAAARLRAPSAWGVFGLCQSLICWRGTRPAYRGQSHKLSQAGSTPAPASNCQHVESQRQGRRRSLVSQANRSQSVAGPEVAELKYLYRAERYMLVFLSAGPAPHLQAMAAVPISRASGPADVFLSVALSDERASDMAEPREKSQDSLERDSCHQARWKIGVAVMATSRTCAADKFFGGAR
jgi:hypothetical protein